MPATLNVSCNNGTFTVTVTPPGGTGRIWIYAYVGITAPTENSQNPLDAATPWQALATGVAYPPAGGVFAYPNLTTPMPNQGLIVFTWSLPYQQASFLPLASMFVPPCGGSSSSSTSGSGGSQAGSSSGSNGLPPGSSSSF